MPSLEPVLEGTFTEFTVDKVLSVVGMSRQCMEMETPNGRLLIKAGMLLDADRPPDARGIPAFVALYRDPGSGFSVYRHDVENSGLRPVGPLLDLVREAMETVPRDADMPVLQGTFEAFALHEVFEVTALSRQVLEIQFLAADGARGAIVLKSGQVLGATRSGSPDGLEAIRRLVRDPGVEFVVRQRGSAGLGEPLGSLAEMLHACDLPPEVHSPSLGEIVLAGDFVSFTVEEVLAVLSLSREFTEARLADGKGERGAILVKSGHVVDARDLRSGATGIEAFAALIRDPGSRFVVVRSSAPLGDSAVGKVADLVEAIRSGPMDTPVRREPPAPRETPPPAVPEPPAPGAVVLEGRTRDFGFEEVLEVLPLSRQHVVVEFRHGEAVAGTLNLKVGRVIAAATGTRRGIDAFVELYADHGDAFEVRRLEAPEVAGALGTVSDLLIRARRGGLRRRERDEGRKERVLRMQGEFAEFPLDAVLDALSLSRLALDVTFIRDGKACHRMLIKAGQIVALISADAKNLAGALRAVRRDPGTHFLIHERRDLKAGKPLAPLRVLAPPTRPPAAQAQAPPPAAPERGAGAAPPAPPVPAARPAPDASAAPAISAAPGSSKAPRPAAVPPAASVEQITHGIAVLKAELEASRTTDRLAIEQALGRIEALAAELRRERGPDRGPTDATAGRTERRLLGAMLAIQVATLGALLVALAAILG